MTIDRKIRSHRSRAGSTLLELALLAPFFGLLLLGAGDFARLFYVAIEVANAVHAGVLYGIQTNGKTSDTTGMKKAATDDAVNITGVTTTASRSCKCSDGTVVNCVSGSCTVGGVTTRPRIYVTVTAAKTFKTVAPYPGVPSTVGISMQDSMRAQ